MASASTRSPGATGSPASASANSCEPTARRARKPSPRRAARARRTRPARVDELLALWRAGRRPLDAASALGLRPAAGRETIAAFASDVDHAARRASLSRAGARGTQTYSDADILAALDAVAVELGRVPGAREYASTPAAGPKPPVGRRCRRPRASSARSRPSSPTTATPPNVPTCRRRPRCANASAAGARSSPASQPNANLPAAPGPTGPASAARRSHRTRAPRSASATRTSRSGRSCRSAGRRRT